MLLLLPADAMLNKSVVIIRPHSSTVVLVHFIVGFLPFFCCCQLKLFFFLRQKQKCITITEPVDLLKKTKEFSGSLNKIGSVLTGSITKAGSKRPFSSNRMEPVILLTTTKMGVDTHNKYLIVSLKNRQVRAYN